MFRKQSFRIVAPVLALALLGVAPAPAQQQQSPEMQIVIAAEQMMQQGNPDGALTELQKIFDENKEVWQAHFVAAQAHNAKGDKPNAFANMIKAAELNPGFGAAHRFASMYAADMGNLDVSWEQAIKAHQAGTDMSDAFAMLPREMAPDNLETAMSVPRVFVAPMDTTAFEEGGDRALQVGADAGGNRPRQSQSASANTNRGQRILQEAAADIALWMREAQRQFSESPAFGLVQRPEQSTYLMIFEVDEMSDSESRRSAEGYVKLLNAQSGEEAYRRRVEFSNISSFAELNRDFSVLMGIMEEWAVEQRR